MRHLLTSDLVTSTKQPTEDQYEVALVVRCLVRLRHHQGYSAVDHAVKEAPRN